MSVLASSAHRAGLLGVGLYVALACSPGGDQPVISEGQALFEVHCMPCHGEGARGDGPQASTLPVQPASILEHLGHHTRAQLVRLIRSGIPPAMPPAALSEEQVLLVIDYAWTLVPEDQVASLRAMQEQTELMGGAAAPGIAGMGAGSSPAPPAGAQEFAFGGTVQSVDRNAGTVSVLNDDVPGWMSSMTMSYAVDPASVMERLEPGDRITAKVYAGDFRTLYGVEIERE
jgi:mono/diheme cytochrome c family protein/Cu/Ag efflux protein CusF